MVFPPHPVLLSADTDNVLRTEETHCSPFALSLLLQPLEA